MDYKKLSKEEFHNFILKARPTTSEGSSRVYYGIYNKLDNVGHIHEYKKMEDYIEENIKNNSTKRNYYVVLLILTEALNGGKYTDKWLGLEEYKFYKKKSDDLNYMIKNTQKQNGGLTENQKENVASLDDIEYMIEQLEKTYIISMLKNKVSKNLGDWPREFRDYYTAYILFKLLLELPVRNEIATLKYFRGKKYIKQYEKIDVPINMLVYVPSTKRFTMVRKEYKTDKTYGTITNELSAQLSKVILKYVEYTIPPWQEGNGVVFPDLDTKDPKIAMTKILNKVSQKYLKKNISSRMMTKISISTPEVASAAETLQQVADTRGTSVGTIVNSYVNQNSSS